MWRWPFKQSVMLLLAVSLTCLLSQDAVAGQRPARDASGTADTRQSPTQTSCDSLANRKNVPATAQCCDTDPTNDQFAFGRVYYTTAAGGIKEAPDQCWKGKALNQYFCEGNTFVQEPLKQLCAYKCVDGKCIEEPPPVSSACVDHDEKATNQLLQGSFVEVTSNEATTKTPDACFPGIPNRILEQQCNQDKGALMPTLEFCPPQHQCQFDADGFAFCANILPPLWCQDLNPIPDLGSAAGIIFTVGGGLPTTGPNLCLADLAKMTAGTGLDLSQFGDQLESTVLDMRCKDYDGDGAADDLPDLPQAKPCPPGTTCEGGKCKAPTIIKTCTDTEAQALAEKKIATLNDPYFVGVLIVTADGQSLPSQPDYCDPNNSTIVWDTVCEAIQQGPGTPIKVECLENETCENGACVPASACSDTEADALATGKIVAEHDPYYVGQVTVTLADVVLDPQPDDCDGKTILLDYGCNQANTAIAVPVTKIDCADFGLVCQQGKCVGPCSPKPPDIAALYGNASQAALLAPPPVGSAFTDKLQIDNAWVYDMNSDGLNDLIWGYKGFQQLWLGAQDIATPSAQTPTAFIPPINLSPYKKWYEQYNYEPYYYFAPMILGVGEFIGSTLPDILTHGFLPTQSKDGLMTTDPLIDGVGINKQTYNTLWSGTSKEGTFASFDPLDGSVAPWAAMQNSPYDPIYMTTDMNGDTLPDLIAIDDGQAYYQWALRLGLYFHTGAAQPWVDGGPEALLANPPGWQWKALYPLAGSFTGNPAKDLVMGSLWNSWWGTEKKYSFQLIKNSTEGKFAAPQKITLDEIPMPAVNSGAMTAGDFNQDGWDDLAFMTVGCKDPSNCPTGANSKFWDVPANVAYHLYLWRSDAKAGKSIAEQPTPLFTSITIPGQTCTDWTIEEPVLRDAKLITQDFNLDGALDLAWPVRCVPAPSDGQPTEGIAFLMGDGSGSFENVAVQVLPLTISAQTTGPFTSRIFSADVNSDLCPDVLVEYRQCGTAGTGGCNPYDYGLEIFLQQ